MIYDITLRISVDDLRLGEVGKMIEKRMPTLTPSGCDAVVTESPKLERSFYGPL